MQLSEREYKAAATTELERRIRDIENRDKTAQTKSELTKDSANVSSNVGFAQQLHLILSRLVDTFSSRILYPMLLLSGNHSIAAVLSWEEGLH